MDEQERILNALLRMVTQYLEERPGGILDNYATSAGEHAFQVLLRHGLAEAVEGFPSTRFVRLTPAGLELLVKSGPTDLP